MSYELSIKLPSNGLPYEGKITPDMVIRNMTTREEKKLLGSTGSTDTIDRIVESCIVEPKGLKVKQLTSVDNQYVLMKLRVHTFGSKYDVMAPACPYCSEKPHEVTVDLDEIPVTDLDKNYVENLSVKLPMSGDELELKLLTVADSEICDNRSAKVAKMNKSVDPDELSYILRLCRTIVTVNGKELDPPTLQQYVEDLHSRDTSYIWHKLGKIEYGYAKHITVDCPKCGGEIEFKLPMNGNFFRSKFDD